METKQEVNLRISRTDYEYAVISLKKNSNGSRNQQATFQKAGKVKKSKRLPKNRIIGIYNKTNRNQRF